MEAKPTHEERDSSGRYTHAAACDCCGKSAGTDPVCDDDVCGQTDGPGFILCERPACVALRGALSVQERAALYAANCTRIERVEIAAVRPVAVLKVWGKMAIVQLSDGRSIRVNRNGKRAHADILAIAEGAC